MEKKPMIVLKNISKKYNLYRKKSDRLKEALNPFVKSYHKDFYAINDISLTAYEGDIIGILGNNGSGKSTLLKVVSGITTPTCGSVGVYGKLIPLIELNTGFHPELTGRENIYFYPTLLGYPKEKINDVAERVIKFADIGEFIDQPLKMYSSGMKSRLGFSVSINIDPDILILDEILSVGDRAFKLKSYQRMMEFFRAGKTILFVSHSVEDVNELCNRALILDKGRKILEGNTRDVTSYYVDLINKRKTFLYKKLGYETKKTE